MADEKYILILIYPVQPKLDSIWSPLPSYVSVKEKEEILANLNMIVVSLTKTCMQSLIKMPPNQIDMLLKKLVKS